MINNKQIENIRTLSWTEAAKTMEPFPSARLVDLLNHRYTKVAGTASYLLRRRNQHSLIIAALVTGKISAPRNKLMCVNSLTMCGGNCPNAVKAYEHLLSDRAFDVVDAALFGIVFLGHMKSIPLIEERIKQTKKPKLLAMLKLGLRALKADNPYLFSPHYSREAIHQWRKEWPPKCKKKSTP
jgi:hypothetical protein